MFFFFRVTLAEQRQNRNILKKRKRGKHINEIKTPEDGGGALLCAQTARSHRVGSQTLRSDSSLRIENEVQTKGDFDFVS